MLETWPTKSRRSMNCLFLTRHAGLADTSRTIRKYFYNNPNSFSKTWLMTGWRIGWTVVPTELLRDMGKLIEYNTTCAPAFVQHAALHALINGDAAIERTVQRLKSARDHLASGLASIPRVHTAPPAAGAMYSFFKINGVSDSLELCKRLVVEAGLGLAPGIAFGPEGEGYLRWCFASSHDRLDEGIKRLKAFLG